MANVNGQVAIKNPVNEVLDYDVLLEEILSKLGPNDLKNCTDVSLLWSRVSRLVDARRRITSSVLVPFRIFRFEDELNIAKGLSDCTGYSSGNPLCTQLASNWISEVKPFLEVGTDRVIDRILAHIKSLYAPPNIVLLIEANNTKVSKSRRWKRAKIINAIRAALPPSCKIIGLDAHYGLIGTPTTTKLTSFTSADDFPDNGALVKGPSAISHFMHGIFSVSCSFLPHYDGLTIEIFGRQDEIYPDDDLKAIVLISSGVGFHGDFLELTNVGELFTAMNGQLAIGGAQINDKLTTFLVNERFSDDTANYFFVNGRPPYNPMYNPQKLSLIGLKFRGKNVEAACLTINGRDIEDEMRTNQNFDMHSFVNEELNLIETELTLFKSRLIFNVDDNSSKTETIGFLFFNNGKFCTYNQTNAKQLSPGIDHVRRIFKHVKLMGVLTHAQYEHNYWPHTNNDDDVRPPITEKPPSLPTTKPILNLVLIHINKSS